MSEKFIFSSMNKTWLIDVDGTILKHNGHLEHHEILLEGVKEFFDKIPENDRIVLLTAREEKYKEELEGFLLKNKIRFDRIIYDLPFGERILINDRKESGLKTAYAINVKRNAKLGIDFEIDESL